MNRTPNVSLTRRGLVTGLGSAVVLAMGGKELLEFDEWEQRANVFIADAPSYEVDLEKVIRGGLRELGIAQSQIKGKSILLKPNLVETSLGKPQINTNPLLIRAAALVFRSLGARSVSVGEGPGHCRDAFLAIDEAQLYPILKEEKLPFVDLNNDDLTPVPNRFRESQLEKLWLPASITSADLVVSMPKIKTHHWVGVTLSMKNLFGVMPGVAYGWPKNVLHFAGICPSILDITAAVKPGLAIVDGIVGMEGDGPIMGEARRLGVVVMGANLPAVDATCTRLMGFNPYRVGYLKAASGRLGPIHEAHIRQRGETIASRAQNFALLDHPELALLRS